MENPSGAVIVIITKTFTGNVCLFIVVETRIQALYGYTSASVRCSGDVDNILFL